jgi:hypothetical protein
MMFSDLKLSWWLKFSRTLLGRQLRQVVAWQVNKCFANRLCSHIAPADKNRDISRNVCFLAMQLPDTAAGPVNYY